MPPPIIIIPASEHADGTPHKLQVNRPYTDAIERAGGIAFIVARPKNKRALGKIIHLADGLLFLGGHDVHPRRYSEDVRSCVGVNNERDDIEFALFGGAMKKKIPILGICRGMQLMNVALGGSLYQDVHKEMSGATHDHHHHGKTLMPRNHPAHGVNIILGTMLHKLVKTKTLQVNSLHHQGVKALGKGLVASAFAPDGLIEAIELPLHPFLLGVEWHPEELADEPSKGIFDAFIQAASEKRKPRI